MHAINFFGPHITLFKGFSLISAEFIRHILTLTRRRNRRYSICQAVATVKNIVSIDSRFLGWVQLLHIFLVDAIFDRCLTPGIVFIGTTAFNG